jgi:hypothetical protein
LFVSRSGVGLIVTWLPTPDPSRKREGRRTAATGR